MSEEQLELPLEWKCPYCSSEVGFQAVTRVYWSAPAWFDVSNPKLIVIDEDNGDYTPAGDDTEYRCVSCGSNIESSFPKDWEVTEK